MSDYPRDAPAQQLLFISAAPTEQPAIIDLNAAALHRGIPLGTTLGGVPVTRGVPAALISGTGGGLGVGDGVGFNCKQAVTVPNLGRAVVDEPYMVQLRGLALVRREVWAEGRGGPSHSGSIPICRPDHPTMSTPGIQVKRTR